MSRAGNGPVLRILSREIFTGSSGIDQLGQFQPQRAASRREGADSPGRAVPRSVTEGSRATAAKGENTLRLALVENVERLARPVATPGSFDHGVSWKSRLLRLQVKEAPSAELWKPNEALAITLIQGCGVRALAGEPDHIVAAAVGEAAKAVPEGEARRRRRHRDVAAIRGGAGAAASDGRRPRPQCARHRGAWTCSRFRALDLVEDRAVAGVQHDAGHRQQRAVGCARPSGRGAPRRCAGADRAPLPRSRLFSQSDSIACCRSCT